jgi:hypothetical protein
MHTLRPAMASISGSQPRLYVVNAALCRHVVVTPGLPE